MLITLLISALIAGILLRYIIYFAIKNNIYDEVNTRKIHTGQVPRLGGFAFFPAMVITVILIEIYCFLSDSSKFIIDKSLLSPELATLIFAGLVCFVTNIYDDIIGLGYLKKFASQFLTAVLVVAYGPQVDNLCGIANIYTLPPVASFIISVLLIVFIINAMNLIDGIDGLAAIISMFALLYYGHTFMHIGHYVYAFASFSMFGALIPFLLYNLRGGNFRFKIFMGDTGSVSLGLLLAFLSISLFDKLEVDNSNIPGNPIILALAPLLIPCIDVVRVFIKRLLMHKNPFIADNSHIHHRLLTIGLSQNLSLIAILVLTLFYLAFNIHFADLNINLLLAADIGIYVILDIAISREINNKSNKSK